MNNILCIECNKYIHGFKCDTTLYRCGDANVCSQICSKKRYNKLEIIDPYFTSPISWPTANKFNTIKKSKSPPTFYPHTILNIDEIYLEPISEEDSNVYTIIDDLITIINSIFYNTIVSIVLLLQYK